MALNTIIKPQKLAAVAAEVIEQSLVVPGLFLRDGFDNFKGAENDTVYVRVPGILPAHDIANFRAERTSSITFDAYTERKISLTLSGNTYSATKLQDEQRDWDNIQWARVITTQAEAVGRALEDKAIALIKPYHVSNNPTGQNYMATIAGAKSGRDLRASLIELRRVANAFRMPTGQRTLVCGTAIEAAILNAVNFTLAQNVGEAIAVSSLREANIGRIFGFDIVVSQELPANFAVLMVPSAFIMATAGPAVPSSVTVGGTASARNIASRWVLDYDPTVLAERSVVNTYNGVRSVKDVMLNAARTDVIQVAGTVSEFLIRAVAFDLTATADVLPVGGTVGSALDQFVAATGIGTPGV